MVLSFLAWKLAQQFFYTTCTVLSLLMLRFLTVEVAPRGELDDDLAIVLIVSAFLGASLSWLFGVAALALQAVDKCCLRVEESIQVLTNIVTNRPSGQPSKVSTATQAEQAQHVGGILDALTTVLEDSRWSDFDDETNKVWAILRFWEDKMLSFEGEGDVVLTKLVLNLIAPSLTVVLSRFVNSVEFDNSKTTHVDVANALARIKQSPALRTSESSTKLNSFEDTTQEGCASRDKQSLDVDKCIEMAKEYQEVLESVKLAVNNSVRDLYGSVCDLDNTDFTIQLDATYEKINDLSEWLEMFDPADRDVLFKTMHDLLKPGLVWILSRFVESRVFRTFDATHAKALAVLEKLRTFESPFYCDKHKLEKLVETIFELMAASNLALAAFGDWAPSHNHPKLALLEHTLTQQTSTTHTNQPDESTQAYQTIATQPDQTNQAQPGQPDQTFATQPGQPDHTLATQPGLPDHTFATQPGQPDHTFATQPGLPDHTFATQPRLPDQTNRARPGQPDHTFATQPGKPDQTLTISDLLAQFQAEALMIRVLCSVHNPSLSKDALTWQEVRTKTSIDEIRENNVVAFLKAKATRVVYLYSTGGDVMLGV
jgi:hypothetical protein